MQRATEQGKQDYMHIDLGCGIGSVLMMLAWCFPQSEWKSVGIEAQLLSAQLARRSLAYNGAAERVQVRHMDLRETVQVSEYKGAFDLVTGTPPYFNVEFKTKPPTKMQPDGESGAAGEGGSGGGEGGSGGGECDGEDTLFALPTYGALPSCKQSAPARYEFRGGVEEYCKAASHCLAPGGIFVVCEGGLAMNEKRVKKGAQDAGLHILRRLPVVGGQGKPVLFAVYVMVRGEGEETIEDEELVVRDGEGGRTPRYCQLMADMGMPVD
jgi:tRNA1(Val) A37 N6-methylase TrmN6